MRQITFILTFFLLTFSQSTIACDCNSQGEFLIVAPKTKMVALVKIKRYLTFKDIYDKPIPISMVVEVIDIYNGQETRKTITVWGDNGALCRPYLSRFDIGAYYVIAFDEGSYTTEINANKTEKNTDYSISVCGDYWLTVDFQKQIATGAVTKKQTEIKLSDLKMKFDPKGDKTKDLSPTDFKNIFQLALDLPQLQKYYHIDKYPTRKQIYIQYFGDADHYNLGGVIKFEKQVHILSEEEIKRQKVKNYFVVGDWVCGQNSVRLQLSYVGEGLTASYMFKKNDGKWTILNSELWEE